ncbi:MAG TPA: SUMF1/EgtB/PvdO family nonheme iron enzyme [Candidatus Baltobacteraceae bacterium]|jgi:formylglycine-generating enzyme required for sulfatase activity|nr:SUMF1/EgtB/PvdO family nonheme iron enzyme [Candidatus Baltobacteraceae bacterium]
MKYLLLGAFLLSYPVLEGRTASLPMQQETIAGPAAPDDFPQWITEMRRWRREKLEKMNYNGAEYDRPELKWTQRTFIQPQMMVEDRYFYDPVAGKYTVDRYLDDLEKRYGGIDSVLIWAVYCNIGIDARNQFDMVRALPGGIEGARQMVADFHRRGVKVLFPMMPWDIGTRDEGAPLSTAVARMLQQIGADGVNGDTMTGISREFRQASDQTGRILAFEPEVGLKDESDLPWDNLTWGYWDYSFTPAVSKYKWLEPRHMVNICNRWGRNHTDDLQHAFFNGVGFESWENVWGIWNGITPRDAEALRRVATIERAYADLLAGPDWEPHFPTLQKGVFASQFPSKQQTLWTIVNRTEFDISGSQLRVPRDDGARYFDLWNGDELKPILTTNNGTAYADLDFGIEANGYGAILELEGDSSRAPDSLLGAMHRLAKRRLANFSAEWKFLPQHQQPIQATKPAETAPSGMVRIPGGPFDFAVSGIEIEGEDNVGVDVQYPWEDSPRRNHLQRLVMAPFYMDRYPVTNARFKEFLDATGYHPPDDFNFLKDWKNASYPEGWGNKPVTWVSLEDARAYAAWAGKRLPHEWEWQYAAQGTDGRLYPWGGQWNASLVPPPDDGRTVRPAADVDAFPQGASPFSVMDLAGNVWEWTDEYLDEHTRAAIVRGGSHYHPKGSMWYFPNSAKLNEHGKLLLMSPGKDRAATLGFRCVVDAK